MLYPAVCGVEQTLGGPVSGEAKLPLVADNSQILNHAPGLVKKSDIAGQVR